MPEFFSGNGDGGQTDLSNQYAISKSEPIFELLGTLDELNAFIGVAIVEMQSQEHASKLQALQETISSIMALLAGIPSEKLGGFSIRDQVEWLETYIEILSAKIDRPGSFTFPGKNKPAAYLDVCRVITRRAERIAVRLSASQPIIDDRLLAFLNRLSTYFFVFRLLFEQA